MGNVSSMRVNESLLKSDHLYHCKWARSRFNAISKTRKQIADLHNAGHEIILVSSGAVAEGMVRMKLATRPTDLPSLPGLCRHWSNGFDSYMVKRTGSAWYSNRQVLLTHDDLADRRRYLNSCDALQNLIDCDFCHQ